LQILLRAPPLRSGDGALAHATGCRFIERLTQGSRKGGNLGLEGEIPLEFSNNARAALWV